MLSDKFSHSVIKTKSQKKQTKQNKTKQNKTKNYAKWICPKRDNVRIFAKKSKQIKILLMYLHFELFYSFYNRDWKIRLTALLVKVQSLQILPLPSLCFLEKVLKILPGEKPFNSLFLYYSQTIIAFLFIKLKLPKEPGTFWQARNHGCWQLHLGQLEKAVWFPRQPTILVLLLNLGLLLEFIIAYLMPYRRWEHN